MYDDLGAAILRYILIVLGTLIISVIALSVLKWCGVITLNWWAVTSPLWLAVLILAIIYGISFAVDWSRR